MRVVMFYHSALSDWNHGNAHFLRGIAGELLRRGHDVRIYEPEDAWSVRNLLQEHGESAISKFHQHYPELRVFRYKPENLNLNEVLEGTDLVLVHEWNDPRLVARIGAHREEQGDYCLFFHDTHHRSVTAPESMRAYDLSAYDGVLAYGASIREVYLRNGWAGRVWVWHEAADTNIFRPFGQRAARVVGNRNGNGDGNAAVGRNGNGHYSGSAASTRLNESFEGDLVWIGNWGDDERVEEIQEFLIRPVKELGLSARVYGVRYPDSARQALADAGISYRGWLPNFEVPKVFSRFRVTVHIPRRPYVAALPGISTIRPFEALACGIPLVSAYWNDSESLFTPGRDYLVARDGDEMKRHLRSLLEQPDRAKEMAEHGRRTILMRHTCAHRVETLLSLYRQVRITAQGIPA